ncbi:type II toxin-antitoxin system PemK/MazF family toxin [Paenibacillus campi]|uniref:type II toxin-antitoxin system PemK/MazF family toxin n=1 Tax=Paenibacillus campi TaxID=3106031 RepID=UPI002AFF4611|nr:type II toxin-antitoxin system PemK/MazF family toxin [Paenibacillus sp. SGZ-1014]
MSLQSVYEMGQWIISTNRLLNNYSYENGKDYPRGTIIQVDLGATNFRYEPSFAHPCIVLVSRKSALYVVPCSSKKYGKGYRDIIDATNLDGFLKNTGVQVESGRWIHRNRIIQQHGKASMSLLTKIDNHLIQLNPTARTKIASIHHIQRDLDHNKQELMNAQEIIKEREQEIFMLKEQIKALEDRSKIVEEHSHLNKSTDEV